MENTGELTSQEKRLQVGKAREPGGLSQESLALVESALGVVQEVVGGENVIRNAQGEYLNELWPLLDRLRAVGRNYNPYIRDTRKISDIYDEYGVSISNAFRELDRIKNHSQHSGALGFFEERLRTAVQSEGEDQAAQKDELSAHFRGLCK